MKTRPGREANIRSSELLDAELEGHAVGRRLEARLVHEERTAADDLLLALVGGRHCGLARPALGARAAKDPRGCGGELRA